MATILGTGLLWGTLWFAVGFFGPMLAGGGNQGPLLGILITGPLGFVVGCGVGTWRQSRSADVSSKRPAFPPWQQSILAIIAGFAAQLMTGIASLMITALVAAPYHSVQARALHAVRSLVVGYAVARIAPRAPLAHAGVFAAIQLAMMILGSFGHLAPGAAAAIRIDGAIVALAVLAGGLLHARTQSKLSAD